MSRLAEPGGFTPTTVPASGVSAPWAPIAKPATDDVPAFDAYTNRPSGVTTFQQFAAPSVGTLWLTGSNDPSATIEYDEIAEPAPPPVSDTSSAPFAANATENAPAPGLAFTLIGDSLPSASTRNTSMLLVVRSVTTRKRQSPLNASEAESTKLPERNRSESAMRSSCPLSQRKPTTLALPAVLST